MMLISVFYQLLLYIGDTILFGGLKFGYGTLDMSRVGTKYFGIGVYADLILDNGHAY